MLVIASVGCSEAFGDNVGDLAGGGPPGSGAGAGGFAGAGGLAGAAAGTVGAAGGPAVGGRGGAMAAGAAGAGGTPAAGAGGASVGAGQGGSGGSSGAGGDPGGGSGGNAGGSSAGAAGASAGGASGGGSGGSAGGVAGAGGGDAVVLPAGCGVLVDSAASAASTGGRVPTFASAFVAAKAAEGPFGAICACAGVYPETINQTLDARGVELRGGYRCGKGSIEPPTKTDASIAIPSGAVGLANAGKDRSVIAGAGASAIDLTTTANAATITLSGLVAATTESATNTAAAIAVRGPAVVALVDVAALASGGSGTEIGSVGVLVEGATKLTLQRVRGTSTGGTVTKPRSLLQGLSDVPDGSGGFTWSGLDRVASAGLFVRRFDTMPTKEVLVADSVFLGGAGSNTIPPSQSVGALGVGSAGGVIWCQGSTQVDDTTFVAGAGLDAWGHRGQR